MQKKKKYCPCCGHEMFSFTTWGGLVYICSYAPCQTKYFAGSDRWDIAEEDKPSAKQNKQIQFINKRLCSEFSALTELQANEIIENYYGIAQYVKRGDNNG